MSQQQQPLVIAGADTDPNAPILMFDGIGPVMARRMTIASAHFEDKHIQFMHSGRRIFTLKAAPKGELSYLNVYDSQQPIQDTSNLDGEPGTRPGYVSVESIIADMERAWGMIVVSVEGALPVGIGRIKGTVATPEEKNRLIGIEERLCRAFVNEADRIHRSGKGMIEKFHRDCLEWLGSEKRDWFQEIQFGRTKIGPLSSTRIPMEALFDAGQDLLAWYTRYGFNPLDYGDEHIANLLTNPQFKNQLQKAVPKSA